nr:MAG TPA: hypothetical protein [Caudoviricetes sp.]
MFTNILTRTNVCIIIIKVTERSDSNGVGAPFYSPRFGNDRSKSILTILCYFHIKIKKFFNPLPNFNN